MQQIATFRLEYLVIDTSGRYMYTLTHTYYIYLIIYIYNSLHHLWLSDL